MSLCLSPKELIELTGKLRSGAQRRVLEGMGVPYRQRPDGTLVVIRTDVLTAPTGREEEPALRFGS